MTITLSYCFTISNVSLFSPQRVNEKSSEDPNVLFEIYHPSDGTVN